MDLARLSEYLSELVETPMVDTQARFRVQTTHWEPLYDAITSHSN